MIEWITENLPAILLIVTGAIGVVVTILDFAGEDFVGGPWSWLKGPLPMTLLIVSALSIAMGLERAFQFQRVFRALRRIEELLAENPERVIRSLSGVDVKTFGSAEEVYNYTRDRMLKAKRSIDDLTLGPSANEGHPTSASQKAFEMYVQTIPKVCSSKPGLIYREVMTFPPTDRISRAENMLRQNIYGYRLRYYNYRPGEMPPLMSFMVIDGEEVIIAFYRTPYLPAEKQVRLAIKHPDIVRLFQDYYDTIWQGAQVLKEGSRVDYEALKKLKERYGLAER